MPSFNKNSARRVAQTTRRIEQTPRSQVPTNKPPLVNRNAKYAIVSTPITAAVPATRTLGKGYGVLQQVIYDSSDNATYATLGITVPLYCNAPAGSGVPIASGRVVVVDYIDGRYHVVVDFCGS